VSILNFLESEEPMDKKLHEFSEAEKIYDTNTIINLIISVVFENKKCL
jgi:hypothetical protein